MLFYVLPICGSRKSMCRLSNIADTSVHLPGAKLYGCSSARHLKLGQLGEDWKGENTGFGVAEFVSTKTRNLGVARLHSANAGSAV